MSEDKVRTKDSRWSMGMIYDPKGLIGVSTVSPEVDEVLRPTSWGLNPESPHLS
jgi:hypothetical protein